MKIPVKQIDLARVLGLDPAHLAANAQRQDKTRELADLCVRMLQAIGELPAPEYAPGADKAVPEAQRNILTNFGNAWHDCRDHIRAYRDAQAPGRDLIFLDVGGSQGECRSFAEGFKYWLADLVVRTTEVDRAIEGDICEPLPIAPDSVDVIFSNNVWEHLARPWDACLHLGKILRPGGLFVTCTIMSYRYHPFPEDYFRFTHSGLAGIHETYAGLRTVLCNYDLRYRRHDHRGGAHPLGADRVPVDYLGGFRENWLVYYIGRKPSAGSEPQA